MANSKPSGSKSPPAVPTYISSSGQTLSSVPLTVRLNRFADDAYNFLGLYFVSLLSLDPHAAAQGSRFNTRGPGRTSGAVNANANRGGNGSAGLFGGGRVGGGGPAPRSGGPGGGDGASGRRMGTVNDVREPECGSCG